MAAKGISHDVSIGGFPKGFSAQHCLIVMIEKWKKSIDQRKNAGALLTDLSKAHCQARSLWSGYQFIVYHT